MNFEQEISEKLAECFRAEDTAKALKLEANTADIYARQLKMEIKALMEEQGVLTMETEAMGANFIVSVKRKTRGVIVTDESKLPEYVFVTERRVDLTKLKKAIGSGAPIDGACLSNGEETTIAIRAKT